MGWKLDKAWLIFNSLLDRKSQGVLNAIVVQPMRTCIRREVLECILESEILISLKKTQGHTLNWYNTDVCLYPV